VLLAMAAVGFLITGELTLWITIAGGALLCTGLIQRSIESTRAPAPSAESRSARGE
jgi:hypothetical protein